MTISSTANKVVLYGNGVTTGWPYKFPIPNQSQMAVIVTDPLGNQTTLTQSQYTVTGIGGKSGGSVTYPLAGSPLAALWSITILRTLPLVQQTDIVNQDGFYPDVLESAVDYLTMVDQQLAEAQSRSIAFPVVDDQSAVTAILPAAAARATKPLIFDSTGNAVTGEQAYQEPQTLLDSAKAVAEELVASVSPGSGTGFFLQDGVGAVGLTFQAKLRNSTPLDPRDFGADGTGTTDSSSGIYKAWVQSVLSGRPVVGLGKFRISAPVVLDSGESINVAADSGLLNRLVLAQVSKDAGNFTAISLRNMRRPAIRVAFSGGGNGALTDIGIDWQNVEGMYLWLSGFAFNGLLANFDGTQGQWVENVGGIIHARSCMKAFNFAGPSGNNSGTGKLDSIWDVMPAYGSNLANLSDLTVTHIENTIIQSAFKATTSLGMIGLSSCHFGKVNLGNGASTLLDLNTSTNVDIDSLYVVGGTNNSANTSTVTGLSTHSNALIRIGSLSALSCLKGIDAGNGSDLQIGRFNGLQNGNDIVFDQGSAGTFGLNVSVDEYFSQQAYGESINTIGNGLSGRLVIKSGRIRTGNVGGAATAAINTAPASMTASSLLTHIDNFDVDFESGATKYPVSVKTFFRGNLIGSGNRFLSTIATQDSYGSIGSPDGRGFILDNPPQTFATWTVNEYYIPIEIWVPFRFETTSVVSEHCTLQLKSPSGTIYDLVDTRYLSAAITQVQYFVLKAVVPPGWSYQFITSNSANVTFQGSPRSISV